MGLYQQTALFLPDRQVLCANILLTALYGWGIPSKEALGAIEVPWGGEPQRAAFSAAVQHPGKRGWRCLVSAPLLPSESCKWEIQWLATREKNASLLEPYSFLPALLEGDPCTPGTVYMLLLVALMPSLWPHCPASPPAPPPGWAASKNRCSQFVLK